ncbi:hypothetical protein CEP52_005808 [Fusarium oligoseptatum]|uniref:Zn(2)-C6 fungal-type domain-containing protein n=1 Tax=Fusarium oligoseptatum TaxID=2604345 RepID=A0A428TW08_9HYPO|nr:hypothetical protein CEP52_005808 [Fusarium oligoseptatum]
MDATAAARRRRKRRVADENRKRAARACDRCKARKSKCIEASGGICQRCQANNLTCRFEKERPSSRDSESPLSLQNPVTAPPSQSTTTPQQDISIDSHQTERVLWPNFLSRLREAFSLDAMSGPEEQDMAAMQARITRPKALSLPAQSRLKAIVDSLPPKTHYADYIFRTRSTESTKPTESANAEAELEDWKKSLPEDFDLDNISPRDSRYRAVFHLYLNYYYAWIAIGKVSLITAVRTTLQHHLNQEFQPFKIDEAIERASRSCVKAARKLLQLFEDLARTGNTARFSFTDFQGCSIATIVTLIAGILERDSTYESRVNFGLNCLRDMAAGNLTAKVGVRFVETLQSISNEAAYKLRQSTAFSDKLQEDSESLHPSAYNDWATWLASQQQPQTNHFDCPAERDTADVLALASRDSSAPDGWTRARTTFSNDIVDATANNSVRAIGRAGK